MEPEQLGIIRKATFGWSADHTSLALTVEVQIIEGRFTEWITDRESYERLLIAVSDVSNLPGTAVAVVSRNGVKSVKRIEP